MKFLQIISDILLLPISIIYNTIIFTRNLLYDKQIFKSEKLSVPVISIGNITAGGTGKTPFTISLAKMLQKNGYKVGIITRGYKRKSKGQIVVSIGKGPEYSAEICGDEPYLMAQKTSGINIIADKNRISAGKTATNKYECNIILVDDGFQHRKLARDVNILLWDSYADPNKESVIPTGRLRESFKGLNRASFIVITRTDSPPEHIEKFFKKKKLQIFTAPTIIDQLLNPYSKQMIEPDKINNKSVYAFCGLGNHGQFFDTIKTLNPQKLITSKFPDHFKYTENHIQQIQKQSVESKCDYIITTEKDFANFPVSTKPITKLLLISISMDLSGLDLDHII